MNPDLGLLGAVGLGLALGGAIVMLAVNLRPRQDRPDALRRERRWPRASRRLASGRGMARLALAPTGGVLVLITTRWPVAASAAVLLILCWPYLFGGHRAEQSAIRRLEALIAWTEALRDTVAANVSLEQAIAASIHQAPPLIRAPLHRLAGRLRVQTPLDQALMDLAADLDDPSADLVVAALVLNVRRRGDRLAQVLSGLAASIREELDLRRRVSAGRAGLRRSVQIVVVITLALAGYLTLFGGTYLRPYDDPAGQGALVCVVALFATGFVWMRRLAVADDARPLLARPDRALERGQAALITSLVGQPTARPLEQRTEAGRPEGRWS